MTRWNNETIKIALGVDLNFTLSSYNVSIDSRKLQSGDIFVAIKDSRDGHEFVAQALDKGASCAIVEKIPNNLTGTDKLILVNSTQDALNKLGLYRRSVAKDAKTIAVTGSVGKTTTKEMLRSTLNHFGQTIYSKESYNNHLGVPLSLSLLKSDSKFGVFEVGMNNPGEIAPLSKMIKPDIAIITTLAPSHIGNMGSLEAIADEKSDIFSGLAANGKALLHGDHPLFERMKARAQSFGVKDLFTAGTRAGMDARLLHYQLIQHGKSALITAEIFGKIVAYPLQFAGEHFAFNSLYVLLTAEILGLDLGQVMQKLAKIQPVKGRGQMLNLQLLNGLPIFVFDDAYNANPTSMTAGLKSFCAMQHKGRKIAVLGQMNELGDDSDAYHAKIGEFVNTLPLDCVHVIGPMAKPLFEAISPERRGLWFENIDQLIAIFMETLEGNESIFLKGSNSLGLRKLLENLKEQLKDVA